MKEATETWSQELQTQASMLAWEINKDTEDADVEAMLAKKIDYFEFVYTLITKQCEAEKPQTEVTKVMKVLAQKWSDERKLKLVEYLVRDSHENPAGLTPYMLFKLLQFNSLPPFWILYVVSRQTTTPTMMSNVLDHMDDDGKEAIQLFLEGFIALPSDERNTLMESYPFFAPKMMLRAVDLPRICESFLQALSAQSGIPLSDEYYRWKRPAFISQIINLGLEQSISIDNAKKLVLRHLGKSAEHREENETDIRDALLLLSPWPVVAKKVRSGVRLRKMPRKTDESDDNELSQFSTVHPELLRESNCDVHCHALQTHKTVEVIGSPPQFHAACMKEAEMKNAQMIVLVEWPRIDPRNFNPLPAFIAFKAVEGAKCFGFYPGVINDETKKYIYNFLASKTIFTQSASFKDFLIENVKTVKQLSMMGFANANAVCLRECQGHHGGALSRFVWDLPFCPSASRDLLIGDLNETQQLHIAYKLELLDRVVQKVTVSKVISAYGINKAPNAKKNEKKKMQEMHKNWLKVEIPLNVDVN